MPKELSGSDPGRILRVLLIGVLMAALDIGIVGPALPAIQAKMADTQRQIDSNCN